MSKNDIEAVILLAKRIWHEHYADILDASQIDYMLSTVHSEKAVRGFIARGGKYYIVDVDGEAAGYFAYISEEKKVFIDKIYIDKSLRGCGIGRKVVEFVKNVAISENKNVVALDVNKYNANSIAAYRAFGFETERAIVNDIGNGYVMDDFVMYLYLKNNKS